VRCSSVRRIVASSASHRSSPSCARTRSAGSSGEVSPPSGTIATSGCSAASAASSWPRGIAAATRATAAPPARCRARAPSRRPPGRGGHEHARTGEPIARGVDRVADVSERDAAVISGEPVQDEDRDDHAVDRDALGQADEDQQAAGTGPASRPAHRRRPCRAWPPRSRRERRQAGGQRSRQQAPGPDLGGSRLAAAPCASAGGPAGRARWRHRPAPRPAWSGQRQRQQRFAVHLGHGFRSP